jgi:hypothetical protein
MMFTYAKIDKKFVWLRKVIRTTIISYVHSPKEHSICNRINNMIQSLSLTEMHSYSQYKFHVSLILNFNLELLDIKLFRDNQYYFIF